ncbi:hypothetical protein SBOR_5103 [Sclerotinia borealis F-4128]|uniref:Uncharacterized protein n=1 Tax=Sclerotinia borealis (strain F-4128) TaxID=1432307 RepID=W9CF44_SCLBF|nr:hypothetical protein SBOR_5103 [Sclerotinia borealis F-4128]
MASWKVVLEPVDETKIEYTSFANARKYFAVDASGSTVGIRLISEHIFAEGIHEASLQKEKNTVTRWGSKCKDPTNWEQMFWAPDQGGTTPQWILRNRSSMDAIHNADIWFLLTDGEVPDSEVHTLAGLGQEMGVFDCATVFVIASHMKYAPNHANVSRKQEFQRQLISISARSGTSAHHIKQPTLVDLDTLLRAGVTSDEDRDLILADEALDALILACKSRGKINELRSFLLAHKIEQLTIKLKDVSGAADLIAQIANSDVSGETKTVLQSKLRDAHEANQRAYVTAQNDGQLQSIRDRNRRIDTALRTLSEAEKSGFSAEILSRRSNRARRAENVSADSSIDVSVLDLEAPGYRGECEVCCGDDEILSITLKVLSADAMAANTDNFALDFPLAAGRFEANMNVVSSQCICFQCALFGRPGYSIYGEKISAVIPTLEYTDSNKLYLHQQLYKALNAGLKTGVPAMGQLFSAILDCTLRRKVWAGAGIQEGSMDAEVRQRRNAMNWLLQSILTHLRVRETFAEPGQ